MSRRRATFLSAVFAGLASVAPLAAQAGEAKAAASATNALAEAGKLAEQGKALEAEIAQRVTTSPERFDLARYDRLNRQALEGLALSSPSLRPDLAGRRLAGDAGVLSDLVVYRLEVTASGPFSALHAYLVRLGASLGGGRAQLESLRLEAEDANRVRLAALYALPHYEPETAESPLNGDLAEVLRWLETQNARRRTTVQLLDELAASSRPRALADAIAALGRQGGFSFASAAATGDRATVEGTLPEGYRVAEIKTLLATAGFAQVELELVPEVRPCLHFKANLRVGPVEPSTPDAAIDRIFRKKSELCAPELVDGSPRLVEGSPH